MEWIVGSDNQRTRVVREDVLLAWWRDRMAASPVHQYRMRAKRREAGLPDLPVTLRPKHARNAQKRNEGSTKREQTPSLGTHTPERPFDPLESVKPLRGGEEYARLQEALRDTPAPCADDDAFTADTIPTSTAAELARICASCPVRDLCAAFAAVNRPGHGYWAGQSWQKLKTTAA